MPKSILTDMNCLFQTLIVLWERFLFRPTKNRFTLKNLVQKNNFIKCWFGLSESVSRNRIQIDPKKSIAVPEDLFRPNRPSSTTGKSELEFLYIFYRWFWSLEYCCQCLYFWYISTSRQVNKIWDAKVIWNFGKTFRRTSRKLHFEWRFVWYWYFKIYICL